VCIILVRHDPPINRSIDDHNGVHHSFMLKSEDYRPAIEHLRKSGVEVFFEEDRQGGVVNGPRCYFRDPDGTVLEYIDLTSYAGAGV
jgi:catechol 2,3-dioxygenase-like lactoylglutathione lyase family enzyme